MGEEEWVEASEVICLPAGVWEAGTVTGTNGESGVEELTLGKRSFAEEWIELEEMKE